MAARDGHPRDWPTRVSPNDTLKPANGRDHRKSRRRQAPASISAGGTPLGRFRVRTGRQQSETYHARIPPLDRSATLTTWPTSVSLVSAGWARTWRPIFFAAATRSQSTRAGGRPRNRSWQRARLTARRRPTLRSGATSSSRCSRTPQRSKRSRWRQAASPKAHVRVRSSSTTARYRPQVPVGLRRHCREGRLDARRGFRRGGRRVRPRCRSWSAATRCLNSCRRCSN